MTNQETGNLIRDTAVADGLPQTLADLIEAQSRHETGNYTSNAFIKNKNCFGYKRFEGSKWQTGAGITSSEKDPYANYVAENLTEEQSIQHSVHELTDWIKRRQKNGKFPEDLNLITTPTDYSVLLKHCGYFGDPIQNYINGLTHYLIS